MALLHLDVLFKTFHFDSLFTLNTFVHHQYSLLLDPKKNYSPSVIFFNFLISCSVLSHISFVFLCSFVKPPFKILCWKILSFSPYKCHNLILGVQSCLRIFCIMLTLTFVSNNICWIVKLSLGKTL